MEEKDGGVWKDPPTRTRKGWKWSVIMELLKENPGRWRRYEMSNEATARSTGGYIKRNYASSVKNLEVVTSGKFVFVRICPDYWEKVDE